MTILNYLILKAIWFKLCVYDDINYREASYNCHSCWGNCSGWEWDIETHVGRRGVCRTAVQHGGLVPKLRDSGFLAEEWLFVERESQIGWGWHPWWRMVWCGLSGLEQDWGRETGSWGRLGDDTEESHYYHNNYNHTDSPCPLPGISVTPPRPTQWPPWRDGISHPQRDLTT